MAGRKVGMENFLDRDLYITWLSKLFKHYNNDDNREIRDILWEELDRNKDDPYSFLIFVATEARFVIKSKKKSFTEIAFTVFQEWMHQRVS